MAKVFNSTTTNKVVENYSGQSAFVARTQDGYCHIWGGTDGTQSEVTLAIQP